MIKMSLTKNTDNAEMRVCVLHPRFTHCTFTLNRFKCLHRNWGFEAAFMIQMSLAKDTDDAEMRVCVLHPRFTHYTFTEYNSICK